MNIIKRFKLFLEKFTDKIEIKSWTILYNHNLNHDINDKIIKRTEIKSENDFNSLLNELINKVETNNLIGDYTFVSFQYSVKIVTRVKDLKIKIITVLGKNENSKKKDKIVII